MTSVGMGTLERILASFRSRGLPGRLGWLSFVVWLIFDRRQDRDPCNTLCYDDIDFMIEPNHKTTINQDQPLHPAFYWGWIDP